MHASAEATPAGVVPAIDRLHELQSAAQGLQRASDAFLSLPHVQCACAQRLGTRVLVHTGVGCAVVRGRVGCAGTGSFAWAAAAEPTKCTMRAQHAAPPQQHKTQRRALRGWCQRLRFLCSQVLADEVRPQEQWPPPALEPDRQVRFAHCQLGTRCNRRVTLRRAGWQPGLEGTAHPLAVRPALPQSMPTARPTARLPRSAQAQQRGLHTMQWEAAQEAEMDSQTEDSKWDV